MKKLSRRLHTNGRLMGLALIFGLAHLHGQGAGDQQGERNRRLFTQETFNGNGRTCETCHSLATGTVSPQEAQARHRKNPLDPLFLFDGSDDGQSHGSTRMQADATILVEIPLPANVEPGGRPGGAVGHPPPRHTDHPQYSGARSHPDARRERSEPSHPGAACDSKTLSGQGCGIRS